MRYIFLLDTVIPSALGTPISYIQLPFDMLFPSLVFSVMTPRDKVDCSLINVWAREESILTEKLLRAILQKVFNSFFYVGENQNVVMKVVLEDLQSSQIHTSFSIVLFQDRLTAAISEPATCPMFVQYQIVLYFFSCVPCPRLNNMSRMSYFKSRLAFFP